MIVRKAAILAAISTIALAGAAAASPGEIASTPRVFGGGSGLPGYSGPAVRPGDAQFERARHVQRFDGIEAALPLYERAVAAGSARAMTALGDAYSNGDGVPRDRRRGLEYFYDAAVLGDAPAMLALARAFRIGDGVERDPELARYWLVRAAETGYRPAMEVRRRLATR